MLPFFEARKSAHLRMRGSLEDEASDLETR
jgi:hypothetical protein